MFFKLKWKNLSLEIVMFGTLGISIKRNIKKLMIIWFLKFKIVFQIKIQNLSLEVVMFGNFEFGIL